MTMRTCIAEQRKEKRESAAGEVRLALDDAGSPEFVGHLLDCSKSGFRASHTHTGLSTGQRVRFRDAARQGFALVMWNRILPDYLESGFLILDK